MCGHNGPATGLAPSRPLCDLRVSSENQVLYIEGMIGLSQPGGCLVWSSSSPRPAAISARVDALYAKKVSTGWYHVVPHEGLLEEAKARLRHIFKRAPQAYGLSKRLLHLSASVDLESGLFAESLAQSLLVATEDHKEGVRAARERRAPRFGGR